MADDELNKLDYESPKSASQHSSWAIGSVFVSSIVFVWTQLIRIPHLAPFGAANTDTNVHLGLLGATFGLLLGIRGLQVARKNRILPVIGIILNVFAGLIGWCFPPYSYRLQ
jgi:hypothetical protein